MLKITKVNKSIKGNEILKDLSLDVSAGEIAILLGRSGAGKSTLLRVLCGIETCDSGKIAIDSSNRQAGMVFQHFNLFNHLSVIDNITLALTKVKNLKKGVAEEIARKLLVRYGLEGKENAKVHQLSGGQKQRLAIARTVSLDPDVICLDEPTSALDPQLTRQVAKFISDLAAEGKAVIVTSHDIGLVSELDGVLHYMEKGAIAERGTSSAVKRENAAFPKLSGFISNTDI